MSPVRNQPSGQPGRAGLRCRVSRQATPMEATSNSPGPLPPTRDPPAVVPIVRRAGRSQAPVLRPGSTGLNTQRFRFGRAVKQQESDAGRRRDRLGCCCGLPSRPPCSSAATSGVRHARSSRSARRCQNRTGGVKPRAARARHLDGVEAGIRSKRNRRSRWPRRWGCQLIVARTGGTTAPIPGCGPRGSARGGGRSGTPPASDPTVLPTHWVGRSCPTRHWEVNLGVGR